MRRPLSAALAAVAAASMLAGCGDESSITKGGRVAGETLTVYSLVPRSGPRAGAAREVVLGEKLALQQAGGRVGDLTINFVALDLPEGEGRTAVADAVREAMRDPGISAAICDLSAATARVSVPLLNAAGILHVSPAAAGGALGDPARLPTGRRSFAPVLAPDAAQARAIAGAARGGLAIEATAGAAEQRLARAVRAAAGAGTVATARAGTVAVLASDPEDAFGVVEGVLAENRRARVLLPQELWATDLPERLAGRGRVRFMTSAGPPSERFAAAFDRAFARRPGAWAQVGHDAMRAVLAAIRRAGDDAQRRQSVIDAYFAAGPLQAASGRAWWLARSTADGPRFTRAAGG